MSAIFTDAFFKFMESSSINNIAMFVLILTIILVSSHLSKKQNAKLEVNKMLLDGFNSQLEQNAANMDKFINVAMELSESLEKINTVTQMVNNLEQSLARQIHEVDSAVTTGLNNFDKKLYKSQDNLVQHINSLNNNMNQSFNNISIQMESIKTILEYYKGKKGE